MSNLPRILKVLNVAAKYRLVDYFAGVEQAGLPRFFLKLYGAAWRLSPTTLSKEQRLKLALEELGPIYIKFGQLLSTRRDFLDDALADALQSLQDDVPPFDEPGIEERIESELGRQWDEIFASLSSTPLASASIAQVHSATLHDGEEVVVKVTRPGIEKTIAADIRLLKWVAEFVEQNSGIGKRLRPIEVVNDYEKIIFDELNLQAEAANTSQLRRNFENSDLLYVPRIYWDYCSQHLMVMERIYGIPVADVEALEANGTNFKALAERGVEIFFTQVFEHSFFHADMHPGNIFVDPAQPDEPRYIAIDCAIIGSLSKGDQQYLARNLLAIFQRDYRKVAQLHIECGWVPAETRIHEFESAIRTVCEPIFEKPLKDISFAHLLMQLFRTAGRFDMEVQPSLVLLQKTLLNVEGLGRQLYPELDLWQTALPFLERWNSKRLNPFTLMSRIQENVPDWIDQLPDLPRLLIESAGDATQLAAINESMQRERARSEQEATRRRQNWRRSGLFLLALAALLALPQAAAVTEAIPPFSLGLGAIALVFLSFRR